MINDTILNPKGNRSIKVIEEPIDEPVTVDELKEFARIDHDYEDTLIESFITTARKAVEYVLGRKLLETSMRVTMDEWNSEVIVLPYPPLISVTGVYTIGEDDAATEYSSSNYYVDTNKDPAELVIKYGVTWPDNTDRFHGGYRIDYKAGYGEVSENVPNHFLTAVKIWATDLYEGREIQKHRRRESRFY